MNHFIFIGISINTFLNCNKIKSLTQNPEDIIKALENSNVLSVSDCKTKIYRIKPIEDKKPEDIERCTIYVVSFIYKYIFVMLHIII